jgi:iron(III) transport system ATP-binding protein
VDSRAFLGEHLDVHVKIGERLLHARTHPSMRAPVGSEVYVSLDRDKCVAVPD